MRAWTFGAAVLCVVTGCDPFHESVPEAPLGGFSNLLAIWSDEFRFSDPSELTAPESVNFSITLESATCQAIRGDVKAQLNGRKIEAFERGHLTEFMGSHCSAPGFLLKLPRSAITGGDGALVLTDGSGARIEVDVSNLFAIRDVRPVTETQVLHHGDTVTIEWTGAAPDNTQVSFRTSTAGGAPDSLYVEGVTRTGPRFTFQVPDALPPGPTQLELGGTPPVTVSRCTGIASCAVYVSLNRHAPVNLQ